MNYLLCRFFFSQHNPPPHQAESKTLTKIAIMAKFTNMAVTYRSFGLFQFKLYRESNFKNDNCHGFQNPRFKRPPSDWEILMFHLFKFCQSYLISCRANFTTKTYKFSILVRLKNTFGNYPDFWLLIKIN